MKKLLTFTMILLGAAFLSGCGTGSGRADSITETRYIIVVHNMPSGKCESSSYRHAIYNEGAYNVFVEEKNGTVGCDAYSGQHCAISDYGGTPKGGKSCIIGFDGIFNGYYDDDWGDFFWLEPGWDDGWGDDWWDDSWDDDGWGDDDWDDW